MTELRKRGLVVPTLVGGKHVYSLTILDITRHLLTLGRKRNWSYDTLAWYADLVFATQIGRAMLLPAKASLSRIHWLIRRGYLT